MIMQNIANFKVLQDPNVKLWMQENVFGRFETVQRIVMGQGTMIFGLIMITFALVALLIASKVFKGSPIIKKIQNKLMWSPVFRSQIQMFFPTCLATFSYFKHL